MGLLDPTDSDPNTQKDAASLASNPMSKRTDSLGLRRKALQHRPFVYHRKGINATVQGRNASASARWQGKLRHIPSTPPIQQAAQYSALISTTVRFM